MEIPNPKVIKLFWSTCLSGIIKLTTSSNADSSLEVATQFLPCLGFLRVKRVQKLCSNILFPVRRPTFLTNFGRKKKEPVTTRAALRLKCHTSQRAPAAVDVQPWPGRTGWESSRLPSIIGGSCKLQARTIKHMFIFLMPKSNQRQENLNQKNVSQHFKKDVRELVCDRLSFPVLFLARPCSTWFLPVAHRTSGKPLRLARLVAFLKHRVSETVPVKSQAICPSEICKHPSVLDNSFHTVQCSSQGFVLLFHMFHILLCIELVLLHFPRNSMKASFTSVKIFGQSGVSWTFLAFSAGEKQTAVGF